MSILDALKARKDDPFIFQALCTRSLGVTEQDAAMVATLLDRSVGRLLIEKLAVLQRLKLQTELLHNGLAQNVDLLSEREQKLLKSIVGEVKLLNVERDLTPLHASVMEQLRNRCTEVHALQ